MTDQEKRCDFEWRAIGDDFYSEASPERLADSLREAALFMPQRYLRLGLRFPANSPSCFFAALLHAATATEPPENFSEDWQPASMSAIEALLEHIDDKMDREIALNFTRVIRSRPGEAWSDTTLYQLRIYASQHPDPVANPDKIDAVGHVGLHELGSTILNTVRCTALLAAAHLLWATPGRLNWVINLAEDALTDSSPAVLAANMEIAYAIGKHDLNLACSLLIRACAATNVPIISAQNVRQLIKHVWKREADIEPILTQALASNYEKAVELAGFWSTVGCISISIYQDLAAQAASGSPAARVGVVNALTALLENSTENRTECLSRLLEYLNDHDPKVLNSATRLVLRTGFLDSPEASEFATKFANSAAFMMDPNVLLHALADHEGSLLPFSNAITNSVAQLSGPLADLSNSPSRRQYGASLYVSKLLLQLYDESEQNTSMRSQCLDHWDALLRSDVGSHQHILTQIDSH